MKKEKIIKHAIYTYETSDGREFDNELEAKEWQEILSIFESVRMLDSNFEQTKEVNSGVFVYTKTKEQAEAFNLMQEYFGCCARIDGVGY